MSGVNMLEQMASGIIEEHKTKGRGLTPLVAERPPQGVPDVPSQFLTNEALRDIAIVLREKAAVMLGIADDLDKITGIPSDGAVPSGPTPEQVQKQKEREADARVAAAKAAEPAPDPATVVAAAEAIIAEGQQEFDARLAAQAAEAQAATFSRPASGWVCPNGHDTVEEKVSPRGRQFARCTTCGEFQK